MNYGEETLKEIKKLESSINYKLNLIKYSENKVKILESHIKALNEFLDVDFEKLLELDPCLMR